MEQGFRNLNAQRLDLTEPDFWGIDVPSTNRALSTRDAQVVASLAVWALYVGREEEGTSQRSAPPKHYRIGHYGMKQSPISRKLEPAT